MRRLILLVTALVFANQAGAVPNTLNYQGQLFLNGSPTSGPVAITFRMFDASSGGTELWAETDVVTATQGLFQTTLGDGVALPASLFSAQVPWLEMEVGGVVLTPRTEFRSVPYAREAVHAAVADVAIGGELWSTDGTNVWRSGGNVGIGTSTPAAPLDVNGAVQVTAFKMGTEASAGRVLTSDADGVASWQPAAQGTIGGGGTAGALARFADASTLTPSVLSEILGDVALGSGSPAGRLHVATGQPAKTGLVVRGEAGQFANLQEWLNGAGAVTSFVGPGGGFSGDGSGLTNLDAADIATGNLSSLRLPTGGPWNLSSTLTQSGSGVNLGVSTNVFAGNGGGLTGLNASNISTGNLAAGRLPTGGTWFLSGPLTQSGSNVSFPNTANTFAGNGTGLTALNASNITMGNLAAARLPTGGTWFLGAPLSQSGATVTFANPSNVFAGAGTGLTGLNASSISVGSLPAARLPTGGTWSLSSDMGLSGAHVNIGSYGAVEGVHYRSSGGTSTAYQHILVQCGEVAASGLSNGAGTHTDIGTITFPVAFTQVLAVQLTADKGWYVPQYSALGNSSFLLSTACMVTTGDMDIVVKWVAIGVKD